MAFGRTRRRLGAAATAAMMVVFAPAMIGTAASAGGAPAYGTNVALASAGGVATASGQEVPGRLGPELAIDGISDSDTSRWSGEYADDSWLAVRLAHPATIDHVNIRWSTSCPVRYRLEVSTDGVTWTDATGELRPPACNAWETHDLRALGQPYQYVRMHGLERRITGGFPYGYSINEIEIWDGPEPPPPPTFPVTPKPASVVTDDDAAPFVLHSGARISARGAAAQAVSEFARRLRRSTGYRLPVVGGRPKPGDLQVVVDPGARIDVPGGDADPSAAYELSVTPDAVRIAANAPAGAFYGVQSLRQLFPTFVEAPRRVQVAWTVPCVRIVDGPRFGYRGLMLDLARDFLSVGQIKSFVDSMSELKMNVLHLHLSDDQGWRIEITNRGRARGDDIDYRLLTEVSGQTAIGAGGPQNVLAHPGFLTQREYRGIVAYAAAHHVLVVPEIDMPGHTNAILHAIPQLNTAHSVPQPPPGQSTVPADTSQRVGHTSLDPSAEVTYTFVQHVVEQLAALTPGPYLHVGGDEAASTAHADYVAFMNRVTGIVHDAGKQVMGWNQYADGDLRSGDLVQYYNGSTDGTLAAIRDKGARAVVSWYPNTYLDYPYAQGDFDTYYGWDPAAILPGAAESSIAGVEAPLWTESVRSDDEAEYQVYPRAVATAEVGWTPQAQRHGDDFAKRLALLGGRLTLQGVNFYPSPRASWRVEAAGVEQVLRAHHGVEGVLGVALAPGTSPDEVSATVDWGDGTPPQPATVIVQQQPDIVHGVGAYWVRGGHDYQHPGVYRARLVVTGPATQAEAPFTVGVRPGR